MPSQLLRLALCALCLIVAVQAAPGLPNRQTIDKVGARINPCPTGQSGAMTFDGSDTTCCDTADITTGTANGVSPGTCCSDPNSSYSDGTKTQCCPSTYTYNACGDSSNNFDEPTCTPPAPQSKRALAASHPVSRKLHPQWYAPRTQIMVSPAQVVAMSLNEGVFEHEGEMVRDASFMHRRTSTKAGLIARGVNRMVNIGAPHLARTYAFRFSSPDDVLPLSSQTAMRAGDVHEVIDRILAIDSFQTIDYPPLSLTRKTLQGFVDALPWQELRNMTLVADFPRSV